MTLHLAPAAFSDAIAVMAGALGISETLVEKDYWVTWVLCNLAASPWADHVVFKGGTCSRRRTGWSSAFRKTWTWP